MLPRIAQLFTATSQRAFAIATLLLVLYLGVLTVVKALETYATHQEAARLRGEIERLEEQYTLLESLRDYELTDDFVEQVARRELNLIKPGETAIIVVAPTPAPTEAPPIVEERLPWWRELLARFRL
jgi:cell division protein FtsB